MIRTLYREFRYKRNAKRREESQKLIQSNKPVLFGPTCRDKLHTKIKIDEFIDRVFSEHEMQSNDYYFDKFYNLNGQQ